MGLINITILQQIYVKNVYLVYGAGVQTHDLLIMSLLSWPGRAPGQFAYLQFTGWIIFSVTSVILLLDDHNIVWLRNYFESPWACSLIGRSTCQVSLVRVTTDQRDHSFSFSIFLMGHPGPLFSSFQTILQKKTVDFSGIRARIIEVESKHASHLTNTATYLLHCANGLANVLRKGPKEQ